jgi:hypothetical protein
MYINRLCEIFYGAQVIYDTSDTGKGITRKITHSNYRIHINPIVSEYITLRFGRIINRKMDNKFIYPHIHYINGKYSSYIGTSG